MEQWTLAIKIAAWLSTNIYVLCVCSMCKSIMSFLSKELAAIYSTFIVDWAIPFYFPEHHENRLEQKWSNNLRCFWCQQHIKPRH